MNEKNNPIAGLATDLLAGEKQHHQNLTVYPLFSPQKEKTHYISLSEALAKNMIEIKEVSQDGSVPNLKVMNSGNKRVLLLDSEELKGAKQNRIINTSILLKKRSRTIIPVSCTESGRWSYDDPKFRESGYMADHELRRKKAASVSRNLHSSKRYASDQSQVWKDVSETAMFCKALSPTSAMSDTFEAADSHLQDYESTITHHPGQQGMLVLVNGKVAGLDFISSAEVFSQVFTKLMKSYAMKAYTFRRRWHGQEELQDSPERFIEKIGKVPANAFKSVGHGYDLRLQDPQLIGNALVYRNEVITLSAFSQVN